MLDTEGSLMASSKLTLMTIATKSIKHRCAILTVGEIIWKPEEEGIVHKLQAGICQRIL